MAEFTQEQIDAMIADKVAEAKKGLFTEDDLNKKVTSEVDRRVESGIQKGLETQKKKWEDDFSARAKLSAEELANKELTDKLSTLTLKEQEISRKANLIDAKDLLSEAQIPKANYDNFLAILVNNDAEQTKANVQNFIDVYNKTKLDIETKVKTEMSKVSPPKKGETEGVTKEEFTKMTTSDKIKFKAEHPDKYKEFLK